MVDKKKIAGDDGKGIVGLGKEKIQQKRGAGGGGLDLFVAS